MAGIDAGVAEVLLLDRLNQKRQNINLLVSHHPSSHALASLHEVMDMQIDMFEEAGVPANVAHALFQERMSQVKRRIDPRNHAQDVDAAKLLNVPLLALHTIWDNLGHQFMKNYLLKKKFDTTGEILNEKNKIPEFIEETKGKAGPCFYQDQKNQESGKSLFHLPEVL